MSVELPVGDVVELSEYDELVKVVEEAVDALFIADISAAFEQRSNRAAPQDESPAAANG